MRNFETTSTDPTTAAVNAIIARAQGLAVQLPDVGLTGYFETENEDTDESLYIWYDDENKPENVTVRMGEGPAKRNINFTPEGTVYLVFKRGAREIYNHERGINPDLTPEAQRQAIGYIALSHEVVEVLTERT